MVSNICFSKDLFPDWFSKQIHNKTKDCGALRTHLFIFIQSLCAFRRAYAQYTILRHFLRSGSKKQFFWLPHFIDFWLLGPSPCCKGRDLELNALSGIEIYEKNQILVENVNFHFIFEGPWTLGTEEISICLVLVRFVFF